MKAAATLALLAALVLCGAAQGVEVYKWKDSKGVVHYGDRPASGVAATLVNARDDKVDPDEAERARQRLADAQDGIGDDSEPEPEPAPQRHVTARKPAPTGCAAAWQRYDAAQACFDAHRAAAGKGVSSTGALVCKDVPQPSCAR